MSEYRDDYIDEDDASQEELPITYPIICTNVPESLLDVQGVAAREHFEKFGYVAKILLRPTKKSCIIEYENRDGAERAILNAGAYDGFMFNVTWNKNRRRPKVDNDPEWLPDPDVEAELKAMSGGDSKLPRVQRQKKMEVERPAVVATPPKRPVLRTGIIRKKTKAVDKPMRPETPPLSTASFQPIDKEELRTLITRQWLSASDKLKALEIRDKIIRSRLSARKGAIQGCCPDMCSEKERLLRETQRQIASYEFDDETGNLDPKKAVKQYSRSSADQEEPLAHELRPILVLKDTLLYLLHHIIDTVQDESGLGEWFHFMWDRLRAIRKDITQQNLTCKGSVALVESCARFHAHCAARLVEEPPSSFDQRLNTENLSKCLQSLKYMYGDLRAKGQIDACKREPEFRAYVILLNMNDANFMWEVQRLDPAVLSSPEVRFAIKVFTALDNNNYIQFFKLVKETSYLNACILLRYFNHVRARALHRIIKTYSPRGTSHFPAQELIDMLGFESLGSMELFLENYGLQVISDQDSSNVVLNKTTFHDNDTPAIQERAINMVESKLQTSLAEIIYGECLPPSSFYDYEPHSSFNNQGYFNKSALLAQDQGYSPRNEIVNEVMNLIDNLVTNKKPPVVAKQPESNLLTEKKPSFIFTKPDVPANLPQSVFSNAGASIFMKQQDKENDVKPFQKSGGFVFSEPAQSPASIFSKGINEVDSSAKPNIFKKPVTVFDPTKPPPINPFGAVTVFSGAASSLFGVSPANDAFKKPSDSGENIKSPFSLFGNAVAQQLKTELQEKEEEEKRKIERENQRKKAEEMRLKEEEARRRKEEEDRKIKLKIMEEMRKQEELKKKIEQEKRLLEEAKRKMEEDRKAAELAKQKLELERLEKEKKRKELEIRVEEKLKTSVPEIIEEVLREECVDLSKEAMEWSNRLTESACDVVNELIKEVCLEECAIGVRCGKKLQEIRLKIICRSTVKAWRKYVGRSRLRRLLLHTTPTWLPTRPLPKPESSQMSMLQKMKDFHRRKLPILKISEPNPRETINLFKTVKRTLFQQTQSMNKNNPSSDSYWKVVLSTPDSSETNKSLFYSKWMSSLFSDEQVKTKPNHVLYLSDNRKLSRFVISACNVEGDNTKQPLFSEKITGWSGILFYGETKYLQRLTKRIDTLMSSKCPYEKLPIAIVLVSNTSTNNTLIALENTLELYKESRALDNYKIFQVKEMKEDGLCSASKAALNWLAKHIPSNPCVKGDILSTFLDNCLGSELWYRFNLGLKSSVRKAFESIDIVTHLYNEAIDKIIDIACNKSLLNYPLFAPEFKDYISKNVVYPVDYQRLSQVWKNNFDALRSLLNSLKIKTFYTGIWPPDSFQSLQESLTKYVQSLKWFKNPEDIVLKILNEVQEENIENKSYAWLSVMNNLVKYKISQIIKDLDRSKYKIDSNLGQFLVVYQPDDLYSFRTTPWWYSSKYTLSICPELIELPPDEDSDLEFDYYKSSKKMKFNDKLEESRILEENWLYNVLLDLDTSINERVDCNKSIFKLNEALELEKQKQDELKNFLQAALDEG